MEEQDILQVDAGGLSYMAVFKEIPYKGLGYLVIRRAPRDALPGILEDVAGRMHAAGARMVFVTGVGDGEPSVRVGRFLLSHHDDTDELSCTAVRCGDESGLTLLPFSRENAATFLRIYNANFVSVPGTATYTEGDAARLLGDPGATRAGLLLLDGAPVGNYELCGCGTDTPELAAIGINAEKRGQGLGGRALRLLLVRLVDAGAKRVLLKVSTANPAAYRLYRSAGFQKERTLCCWYTLDAL